MRTKTKMTTSAKRFLLLFGAILLTHYGLAIGEINREPLIIENVHAYWDAGDRAEQSDDRAEEMPLNENHTLDGGESMEAGAGDTHTAPAASASIEELMKKVGQEEGINWKLLMSVCLTESECQIPNCDIKGNCDAGKSHGPFQIFLPAHPDVTPKQANDMEWAARWTAQHGAKYKDNPAMFFKNHNGIRKTNNQWYIDRAMKYYNEL